MQGASNLVSGSRRDAWCPPGRCRKSFNVSASRESTFPEVSRSNWTWAVGCGAKSDSCYGRTPIVLWCTAGRTWGFASGPAGSEKAAVTTAGGPVPSRRGCPAGRRRPPKRPCFGGTVGTGPSDASAAGFPQRFLYSSSAPVLARSDKEDSLDSSSRIQRNHDLDRGRSAGRLYFKMDLLCTTWGSADAFL